MTPVPTEAISILGLTDVFASVLFQVTNISTTQLPLLWLSVTSVTKTSDGS